MKWRPWFLVGLFLMLCAVPSKADNRIVVRTTLGLSGLQQLCLLHTCSVVAELGDPLNQLFLITTPLDATTFLDLLRLLPGIVDAELDQVLSLLGGLNLVPTPLPSGLMSDRSPFNICGSTVWNSYANQPAATIVEVQTAQQQFCGAGVVADIDTGIDPNHPSFAGILLTGYDFTRNQPGASELNDINPSDFPVYPPPPCSPATCPTAATVNQSSAAILDQSSAAILDGNVKYAAFGHGTMVMGVIHLVAPKARLLPLKAFHSDGTGYLSDVLRAIYYAVNNGANVINMSFDFTINSQELKSALDFANQSSLVSIASVGNNGRKELVYPAAWQSDVMGVASINDFDVRSSFSDYGDAIVWVAAPGEAIISTYPFGTYAAGWGTSFSAPFVSGATSLLLNKQSKINYSQAAAAIADAVPVGPDMGNGRLAIEQALQALSSADSAFSVSPTTSTVNARKSAIYTSTGTPIAAFNQQVSQSCCGMPAASTCTFASSTVNGVSSSTGTVTLGGPAPRGAVISLSRSATMAATVPKSVTIAAGSANAIFQISTKPVVATTSVTVSVSPTNATSQIASLMITAAASGQSLTSLSLNPDDHYRRFVYHGMSYAECDGYRNHLGHDFCFFCRRDGSRFVDPEDSATSRYASGHRPDDLWKWGWSLP